MEGKSPLKSKTLWIGFTALITGLVVLVLHYTGAVALGPEALGAAWTDIFSSTAMIALRFVTKGPVVSKSSGAANVSMLFLVMVACLFSGCKTLTVHAKNSIGVAVKQGPPCKIVVTADGEVVATATSPKKCKVNDARQ